jgi:hypothetical protein
LLPRLKIRSAGVFVLLLIVEPFSLYVSTATGDSAIAVTDAAMKGGENKDIRQAIAINAQNAAELNISYASELTVKGIPRLP